MMRHRPRSTLLRDSPLFQYPASGSAAAAVAHGMSQVGDAYVYGAAGPDAFDCSGLTMMASAAAGVALPHSSSAQMRSEEHTSELQSRQYPVCRLLLAKNIYT